MITPKEVAKSFKLDNLESEATDFIVELLYEISDVFIEEGRDEEREFFFDMLYKQVGPIIDRG